MHRRLKTGLLWLALILADQWTKLWALKALRGKDPIPLIPGVLEFTDLPELYAAVKAEKPLDIVNFVKEPVPDV